MTESAPSLVILTFSTGFPHGMAATYRIQLLARGLAELGCPVGVVCTRATDRRSLPKNTRRSGTFRGVRYTYPGGGPVLRETFAGRRWAVLRGFVGTIKLLWKLRARGEADCVLVYGYASNWMLTSWLLVNALRAAGFPLMTDVVEMPWTLKPHRRLPERVSAPLRPFRGLTVISGPLERWVRDEGRRLRRGMRCVRVPALVDCQEFDDRAGRPSQPQALLAVAPNYLESVRFVMDVMRRVWEVQPACRLVVTGIDSRDPRAARVLESFHWEGENRIILAGYLPREDLLVEYARSSVCLAPLFQDDKSKARFPTKVVEYLASGRPVVTNRVGELATVLTHGETAMLVDPDDVAAFAACVVELLHDESLWRVIADNGRRLAEEEFDYRVHAPALLSLITELGRR